MPIEVTLTEKVSGDVWSASGTFSNDKEGTSYPFEALVQVTPDPAAKLVLDCNLKTSTLDGHKVVLYTNASEPIPLESKPKKGMKLTFRNIWASTEPKK